MKNTDWQLFFSQSPRFLQVEIRLRTINRSK